MRRVILYGDNRLRAHRPMLKPTFILMQQQCIYVIKYETGFLAVFGVSGSGGNITSTGKKSLFCYKQNGKQMVKYRIGF